MKRKLLTVPLSLGAVFCLVLGLAACGGGGKTDPEGEKGADGHTHVAQLFRADESGHWKVCTVCGNRFSVGDHSYNSDNACETCGYNTVYTEGLTYELNEDTDTYTVTGIGEADTETKLVLPAYYAEKAVTAIGENAFRDCTRLKSCTLGAVISVGNAAFSGCTGLVRLTLPDSVTSLGKNAFSGCTGLVTLTIGNGVTSLAYSVFSGCTGLVGVTIGSGLSSMYSPFSHSQCEKLERFTVSEENQTYSSAGGILYNKAQTELIEAPRALKGALTLPETLTSIPNGAFVGCSGLTGELTLPQSVTTIGDSAFCECSGFTKLTFLGNVTEIDMNAFYGCRGLTGKLTLPQSVTSIGDYAFGGCSGITDVSLPNGLRSIGVQAFALCTKLTSVTIPNSVTSFGIAAFTWCSGLTNVTLEEGLTVIGGAAFQMCEALRTLAVPASVTSIGENVFDRCPDFTGFSVDAANPAYCSEGGILYNKAKTRIVEVPQGLRKATIPEGVTEIAAHAFEECAFLTSIGIPASVTSIGERAFSGCMGLRTIAFGGSTAAWTALRKAADWNYRTELYTVTCTDGTVDKYDNVTLFPI